MINSVILGCKKTRPTGILLSKILHGDYEEEYLDRTKDYQLIWRWGNYHIEIPEHSNAKLINKKRGVARNKAEARANLIQHKIPCPRMFNSENISSDILPLIARPVFHMKGKNFYIADTLDKAKYFLEKGYYLQEIIKSKEEFRIFTFRSKILECNIKIQTREPIRPINPLVRNFRNGYTFRIIKMSTLPEPLIDNCRYISEVSGLDFCAIDCCIDNDNMPYIFEVNSSPGLIERKAIKFCKKIFFYLGIPGSDEISIDNATDEQCENDTHEQEIRLRPSLFDYIRMESIRRARERTG